jgi:hypothetical protein
MFNMITLPADSVRKYPPPYHSAGPFSNTRENIADSLIYLDTAYSTSERVEDLLGRMTLEEKVGQMTQAPWQSVNPATDMALWKIGSLLNGGGGSPVVNTPEGWANMIDGFQVHALRTPLGIPYIYGTDAVHGHNNLHGADLSHNIGMGCPEPSWSNRPPGSPPSVAASGVTGPLVRVTVPQDQR